jgi:hypothetical protein
MIQVQIICKKNGKELSLSEELGVLALEFIPRIGETLWFPHATDAAARAKFKKKWNTTVFIVDDIVHDFEKFEQTIIAGHSVFIYVKPKLK